MRAWAALLCAALLVRAATAECQLAHACSRCNGAYDATHCKCTCPYSKLETILIAHVGLIAVLIVLFT